MRIGIDVGGTHTDAVILDGDRVIAATKTLTSADVVSGITQALDTLLKDGGIRQDKIETVMIGTTQFTNAIVQRRELSPVATIRIGLPSGRGMPPMVDWPEDLIKKRIKTVAIASVFSPMNPSPEKTVGQKIKAAIPDARMTLSYNFGRLGLMERENAAILPILVKTTER